MALCNRFGFVGIDLAYKLFIAVWSEWVLIQWVQTWRIKYPSGRRTLNSPERLIALRLSAGNKIEVEKAKPVETRGRKTTDPVWKAGLPADEGSVESKKINETRTFCDSVSPP